MLRARAFTLIELLIVVAIIAILAAIAVPNFLEAQTRSKVSRASADMRSLATALEAYAVDNNRYPPNAMDAAPGRSFVRYGVNFYTLDHTVPLFDLLSTPIAYISSNSYEDPFPFKKNWVTFLDRNILGFYFAAQRDGLYWNQKYRWMLQSNGPNQLLNEDWNGTLQDWVQYDPTNGTVSTGNIKRYGP